MVPLPASGLIGTPTVSRILCEHVLQCFGFPKAKPEAVEEIMSNVVMKNLKSFMKVSLTHFAMVSLTTIGTAVPTLGIGAVVGIVGCILSTPPTARMLLKCACDMILILERAFRYEGKYVSVKQLEDAALYYTTTTTKTLSGKETLLQQHVHDQVDRLIPLKNVGIGFKFAKLRGGLQDIIYVNRYDKSDDKLLDTGHSTQTDAERGSLKKDMQSSVPTSDSWRDWKRPPTTEPELEPEPKALISDVRRDTKGTRVAHPYSPPANTAYEVVELDSKAVGRLPAELEGMSMRDRVIVSELEGDSPLLQQIHPNFTTTTTFHSEDSVDSLGSLEKTKTKSSGNLFKRMGMFKSKK
jgi:hypothetical protein